VGSRAMHAKGGGTKILAQFICRVAFAHMFVILAMSRAIELPVSEFREANGRPKTAQDSSRHPDKPDCLQLLVRVPSVPWLAARCTTHSCISPRAADAHIDSIPTRIVLVLAYYVSERAIWTTPPTRWVGW
jgi:hypothetical protein